jgi:hypothetical protein
MLYNWMVAPYFIGFYLVIRRIRDFRYKYIALYVLVTLIPPILSSYFVSSQKSFPFIVPLMVIIGIGMDVILRRLKNIFGVIAVGVVACYSLLVLYTSYFILFPVERAHAWNYGYDQVAKFINRYPDDKYLLDDTRNPRAYILLLYHLRYSPEKYHQEVDPFYRNNYYKAHNPATYYKLGNVEVRSLDWEKDTGRGLTLIGDPLTISDQQAKEHGLVFLKDILDPKGAVIFKIYSSGYVID